MFNKGDLVKLKKGYLGKYDRETDVFQIDDACFGKDKEILITRPSKQNLPIIYIVSPDMIVKA